LVRATEVVSATRVSKGREWEQPSKRLDQRVRQLLREGYEMGLLSTGAAAEFAGIPKPVFLERLADYGVPVFDMTEEELHQETRLG
jgi:hypothetical protein